MDFFRFQQSGRECVCKWASARNVLKLLYHIVHCAAKYGIHFFVIVHSVLEIDQYRGQFFLPA